MQAEKKFYIGDSVYVSYDGYHVILETNNGLGATNTVYLEPRVLEFFLEYIRILERPALEPVQELDE